MLLTAEQLLREPAAERSGPRSESPRSLSNTALLASLMPPANYGGSSTPLRRSLEPQLVEGLSWFMDRAPWQRAVLSTGIGALVGICILITFGRLFLPELSNTASQNATATNAMAVLTAPAARSLEPAVLPAAVLPAAAPTVAAPPALEPPRLMATAQPSEAAPALADTSADPAPEVKPATGKSARKGKAGKRSKKARAQRTRKTSSLPARWSELYTRER